MRPTALPWCIKHLKPGNPKSRKYHEISIVEGETIYPGGNWNIAHLNPSHHSDKEELALANAEFIIRACKCHEQLVEVCQAAKEYLQLDLAEPGRTIFWNLYDALRKTKELGG